MESNLVLLRTFVREHVSGVIGSDDGDDDKYRFWMDDGFRSDLVSVLDIASDLGMDWELVVPADVDEVSSRISDTSSLDPGIVRGIVERIALVFSIPDIESYPGVSVADFVNRSFAFSNDNSSESVVIPSWVHVGEWLAKVFSISDYGFEDCRSLNSVVISEGLESIESCAFKGCESLGHIDVPASVTSIGTYVFRGCTSLKGVSIHADNPVYHSTDGAIFHTGKGMLMACPEGMVGEYQVPDGTRSIGGSGFEGCSQISSISIPGSVESIVTYAFDYCDNLSSITVDEDNPVYSSCDGILFDKCHKALIRCPEGFTGSYTVPDSVSVIEYAAFARCKGLESLVMPDSVTSIRFHAFEGCTNLRHVTMPKGLNYRFPSWVSVEFV